jgi:integrase
MVSSSPLQLTSSEAYVGTLLAVAKTRGGAVFEPQSDHWKLREATRKLNADFTAFPVRERIKMALKATLVWYAENSSLSHLKNLYYQSRELFDFKFAQTGTLVTEITSADILNYKAQIGREKEWYVGVLSGFLRKWDELGYAGISGGAVILLRQLRLKGNAKGVATATMDPVHGPFTNTELEALQRALNAAYGRQEVSLPQYVLCWLFMTLGQRPTQYAALKVRDVVKLTSKDGVESFAIKIPRAKTRDSAARGAFKERLLVPEVGSLVIQYAAAVRDQFTGVLPDADNAPLFSCEQTEENPEGYAYHCTAAQIGNLFNSALKRLHVVSERTGDFIHITPKRFRQTIGTRAAEEGHGELVIAELLDHIDTQNVGVYVRSTPAIVERIDKAVAMQMAPLAQAFAGKLIKDSSEASRADDPTSVIRAPSITNSFEGMSSCGKHGFCGFMKPVACYTCPNFEPWLDGPHEKILEYLLTERERLLATTDVRIASVNDGTIYAVALVMLLCKETQAEADGTQ